MNGILSASSAASSSASSALASPVDQLQKWERIAKHLLDQNVDLALELSSYANIATLDWALLSQAPEKMGRILLSRFFITQHPELLEFEAILRHGIKEGNPALIFAALKTPNLACLLHQKLLEDVLVWSIQNHRGDQGYDLTELIRTLLRHRPISERGISNAVRSASLRGHTDILKEIAKSAPLSLEDRVHAIAAAPAESQQTTLNILWEKEEPIDRESAENALHRAVANHNLFFVRWILEKKVTISVPKLKNAICTAIVQNCMPLFKELREYAESLDQDTCTEILNVALIAAAEEGNVKFVQWLLEESNGHFSIHGLNQAMQNGASSGSLDVLERILAIDFSIQEEYLNTAISNARQTGNPQVIAALLRLKKDMKPKEKRDIWLENACRTGDLSKVKEALKQYQTLHGQTLKTAFQAAAEAESLPVMKELFTQLEENSPNLLLDIDPFSHFSSAIRKGDREMIHWFLENQSKMSLDQLSEVFQEAVEQGDIETMRSLWALTDFEDEEIDTFKISAAEEGQVAAFYKLQELFPGLSPEIGAEAIRNAAEKGCAPIVSRILDLLPLERNLLRGWAVVGAAEEGRSDLIDQLLIAEEQVSLDALRWGAMKAARRGHLSILKKLKEALEMKDKARIASPSFLEILNTDSLYPRDDLASTFRLIIAHGDLLLLAHVLRFIRPQLTARGSVEYIREAKEWGRPEMENLLFSYLLPGV